MNTLVVVFFLHNALATLILGCKFRSQKDRTLKHFGTALLFTTVAFTIWSVAIIGKVQNLDSYINTGVIFFVISLVCFLMTGVQNMAASNRKTVMVIGVGLAIVLLYLRAAFYPSAPGFSAEGFFFFNPHPVIQMLYIFGLSLAVIPAVDAVAAKIKSSFYSRLFRYGFIAEVAGGIVLITSNINNPNITALYLTGWIIGLVYLILWTTAAFNKKFWQ